MGDISVMELRETNGTLRDATEEIVIKLKRNRHWEDERREEEKAFQTRRTTIQKDKGE